MSFLKKIFNVNKDKKPHFDSYRDDLQKLNLNTNEDLETLVKPLIIKATKLEILKPSDKPEKTELKSHFGGQPYFEVGEEWPKTKKGVNLDFIFQIYNDNKIELPENIKLIQFYYDWDEFPWDTSDDGWFVKIYEDLNEKKLKIIEKPSELEKAKYCELAYSSINSLPDWEGIDKYDSNASKLSYILNEEEPWINYQETVEKLLGEQDYQSQLGGYPKWVQAESTPKNHQGDNMRFLFQIDTNENADISWGDQGLIYVFYDGDTKKLEFILQCY